MVGLDSGFPCQHEQIIFSIDGSQDFIINGLAPYISNLDIAEIEIDQYVLNEYSLAFTVYQYAIFFQEFEVMLCRICSK